MRGPLPCAVTDQIPAKRTSAGAKIFRRLNIFWEREEIKSKENKAVMVSTLARLESVYADAGILCIV